MKAEISIFMAYICFTYEAVDGHINNMKTNTTTTKFATKFFFLYRSTVFNLHSQKLSKGQQKNSRNKRRNKILHIARDCCGVLLGLNVYSKSGNGGMFYGGIFYYGGLK